MIALRWISLSLFSSLSLFPRQRGYRDEMEEVRHVYVPRLAVIGVKQRDTG